MNHYVISQDLEGKHFFVVTAPTPEFPAILIGTTTTLDEAKGFCRELNILATQVDQSAERNLRLVTRLQLLITDIDVDRLGDNPEALSVLRRSSAAMFELLTKLAQGYEAPKPEPGDDIYDSSRKLLIECDHFADLVDEARKLIDKIENGGKKPDA